MPEVRLRDVRDEGDVHVDEESQVRTAAAEHVRRRGGGWGGGRYVFMLCQVKVHIGLILSSKVGHLNYGTRQRGTMSVATV